MRIIMEEAGVDYRIAKDRPAHSPELVAGIARPLIESATECLGILLLNQRRCMKAWEILTVGTVDRSTLHPREIF